MIYEIEINFNEIKHKKQFLKIEDVQSFINEILFNKIKMISLSMVRNLISRPKVIKNEWAQYVKIKKLKTQYKKVIIINTSSDDENETYNGEN